MSTTTSILLSTPQEGTTPSMGSKVFDLSKLKVGDPIPRGEGEKAYKALTVKCDERSITLRLGIVESVHGVSVSKYGVPSFGVHLDPAIPAQKEVIDEFKALESVLHAQLLKMRLPKVTANSIHDIFYLLYYPLDKTTNERKRDGPCTLYIDLRAGKFPIRFKIGNKSLPEAELLKLQGKAFSCALEWDLRYIYHGAQSKFMTGCREIVVSKVSQLSESTAFPDIVGAISEEETTSLLDMLNQGQATKAAEEDMKSAEENDRAPDLKRQRLEPIPNSGGQLSLDDLIAPGNL